MLVDQRQATGATPTGRREPISQLTVPTRSQRAGRRHQNMRTATTKTSSPMWHQTHQTVVSCDTAARNAHDDPWCGRHTRPPDAGSAPRRVPDPQARRVASVKLLKKYGSSWIFEPHLTCANTLWRVQHPGFSLIRFHPFRQRDHHSTHPTVRTHPYNAGAALLLVAVETLPDWAHDEALCHRSR